ncbi:MAG: glycerate kinase [Ruminiclostridium sp.]|nr:glycerate kinase [Ruminiclostridium sp.]
MNIVIAIDSFKGSLTSLRAGQAAAEGIKRVCPDADIAVRPLADGGEGTVDALVEGRHGCHKEVFQSASRMRRIRKKTSEMGGDFRSVEVTDPCGKPVIAKYGIIRENNTAVMEISAAAGLTLVPPDKRDPMKTTTYGVGEMIRDAVSHGCRDFIIGIGGSATNDGGAGMLQAFGFGLLDGRGAQIPHGAEGLSGLVRITNDNVLPELSECRFRIACDVTNPLCGDNGCSAVFAPQKGASPESLSVMDKWLAHFAELTKTINPDADPDYPGAGAAGGLGFAFRSYTNAGLVPGVELVLQETNLESYIRNADIVITGEGRLDAQTAMGKAPVGVAKLAKKHGKPVIAFAGSVTKDAATLNECGIDAYFPILRTVCSLDDAMNPMNAAENLSETTEQVFRMIRTLNY